MLAGLSWISRVSDSAARVCSCQPRNACQTPVAWSNTCKIQVLRQRFLRSSLRLCTNVDADGWALTSSRRSGSTLLSCAGVRTHTVVAQALEALTHLDHRGAAAADKLAGDGVGIMTQASYPPARRRHYLPHTLSLSLSQRYHQHQHALTRLSLSPPTHAAPAGAAPVLPQEA